MSQEKARFLVAFVLEKEGSNLDEETVETAVEACVDWELSDDEHKAEVKHLTVKEME